MKNSGPITQVAEIRPRPYLNRWQRWLFAVCSAACLNFLVLTTAAMIVFQGGTSENHSLSRYQFFGNVFSDLGRTKSLDGRTNLISMLLFILAMTGAGLGIGSFFIAFNGTASQTPTARILSLSAAILGVGAGLCCIGVACTPWDLREKLHLHFVVWTAELLLFALLLALLAAIADGRFSKRVLCVLGVFICTLCIYIGLLTAGLSGGLANNASLQITGQKVIVYLGIFTLMLQSEHLRRASGSAQNVAF